jgi:hypothetical protein
MPHYLIQVGYNTSGLAGLVKEPQDRIEKVTPAIEALGGRVECAYYAFGEHDIVLICEMPDNARGRRRRNRWVLQDHGPALAARGGPSHEQGGRVELQARGRLNAPRPT